MANYTSSQKDKKTISNYIIEALVIGFILALWVSYDLIKEEYQNYNKSMEQHENYEQIVPYIGTIGKYKINMTLNHTQKTGEYYYESQGAENKLYLTILTDTLNQLVIEEKDLSDKVTGNFKGEFQNDSIYTGIFTNSKGKKFKFKLIAH